MKLKGEKYLGKDNDLKFE